MESKINNVNNKEIGILNNSNNDSICLSDIAKVKEGVLKKMILLEIVNK